MKKTTAQLKAEIWVLSCVSGNGFPKSGDGKELTKSLDETHIFDGRDNPAQKVGYYNAVYKGVAVFEKFNLY